MLYMPGMKWTSCPEKSHLVGIRPRLENAPACQEKAGAVLCMRIVSPFDSAGSPTNESNPQLVRLYICNNFLRVLPLPTPNWYKSPSERGRKLRSGRPVIVPIPTLLHAQSCASIIDKCSAERHIFCSCYAFFFSTGPRGNATFRLELVARLSAEHACSHN